MFYQQYIIPQNYLIMKILLKLLKIEKNIYKSEIENQKKNINIRGMNVIKIFDKTDIDFKGKLDYNETNIYSQAHLIPNGYNIM